MSSTESSSGDEGSYQPKKTISLTVVVISAVVFLVIIAIVWKIYQSFKATTSPAPVQNTSVRSAVDTTNPLVVEKNPGSLW
jgi:hypothetical protein